MVLYRAVIHTTQLTHFHHLVRSFSSFHIHICFLLPFFYFPHFHSFSFVGSTFSFYLVWIAFVLHTIWEILCAAFSIFFFLYSLFLTASYLLFCLHLPRELADVFVFTSNNITHIKTITTTKIEQEMRRSEEMAGRTQASNRKMRKNTNENKLWNALQFICNSIFVVRMWMPSFFCFALAYFFLIPEMHTQRRRETIWMDHFSCETLQYLYNAVLSHSSPQSYSHTNTHL